MMVRFDTSLDLLIVLTSRAGITWGFTIAIMALSFSGKFSGCSLAARALGFSWREAGTVGSFMSCKGCVAIYILVETSLTTALSLVELIVLNVGLSAHILTQKVFSMFVLEAVVLTFMTTPLVNMFYPPALRVRIGHPTSSHPEITTSADTVTKSSSEPDADAVPQLSKFGDSEDFKSRFTVVLDRIEHLPGMMVLTQLIQPPSSLLEDPSRKKKAPVRTGMSVDALRLVELSDRTSAVMRSSNTEAILRKDPLLSIFGTFGRLNRIAVAPSLAVVPFDDLPSSVVEHARQQRSQLIFVPWTPAQHSAETASDTASSTEGSTTQNPFEALFRSAGSQPSSTLHSNFVRGIFAQATTDVALFIDHQHPSEFGLPSLEGQHHIFLPFFGGPADRLALNFVAQPRPNPPPTATVVRLTKSEFDEHGKVGSPDKYELAHMSDELRNEATVHTVCRLSCSR